MNLRLFLSVFIGVHLRLILCSSAALQIDVGPVSNATRTTAISYATLTSTNGSTNAVSLILYYGTSDGSTNGASWSASNVVSTVTSVPPVTVTNALSGLSPASQYYCRWYAIEGTNSDWATGTNFTTLAGVPTNGSLAPVYLPVMQNTNGVVVSPANLAAANGLSTTNADAILQAQISSNDTDISSAFLQISSNDTDISSAFAQISSNDTDISSAFAQVSSNDSDIASLQARAGTNESSIAGINSNLSAHVADNAAMFTNANSNTKILQPLELSRSEVKTTNAVARFVGTNYVDYSSWSGIKTAGIYTNAVTRNTRTCVSADGTKIVLGASGVLFMSSDSGSTWTTNTDYSVTDVCMSETGDKLYVATGSGSTWYSVNFGTSFTERATTHANWLCGPTSGAFVFWANDTNGLGYLTSSGTTAGYTGCPTNIGSIAYADIGGDNVLLAIDNTSSNFYRVIQDSGFDWATDATLMGSVSNPATAECSISVNGKYWTIHAGVANWNNKISFDYGATWMDYATSDISKLTAFDGGAVLIHTYNGSYKKMTRSLDGITWSLIPYGELSLIPSDSGWGAYGINGAGNGNQIAISVESSGHTFSASLSAPLYGDYADAYVGDLQADGDVYTQRGGSLGKAGLPFIDAYIKGTVYGLPAFSGAKSVTNSWIDAGSITNRQVFIGGLLTSWTTNGVEL